MTGDIFSLSQSDSQFVHFVTGDRETSDLVGSRRYLHVCLSKICSVNSALTSSCCGVRTHTHTHTHNHSLNCEAVKQTIWYELSFCVHMLHVFTYLRTWACRKSCLHNLACLCLCLQCVCSQQVWNVLEHCDTVIRHGHIYPKWLRTCLLRDKSLWAQVLIYEKEI